MHDTNEMPYHQFQQAFEQYYNPLCNYAYTFLKEFNASEDVVQEVFVKVWEKRQDMIVSDTLRFYLFAAVRNNCLTQLQKVKKTAIVALDDQDVADDTAPIDADSPSEIDYPARLESAMNQLPAKCREVFVLSRMSKQSYKEIAEILNISVKTVENQIGKALKILRNYVSEQGAPWVIVALLVMQFFKITGKI